MGKSNEKTTQVLNEWNLYLSKCVEVYLLFLMVVFVMFCKEGYVAYDVHKRNLFYIVQWLFCLVQS